MRYRNPAFQGSPATSKQIPRHTGRRPDSYFWHPCTPVSLDLALQTNIACTHFISFHSFIHSLIVMPIMIRDIILYLCRPTIHIRFCFSVGMARGSSAFGDWIWFRARQAGTGLGAWCDVILSATRIDYDKSTYLPYLGGRWHGTHELAITVTEVDF